MQRAWLRQAMRPAHVSSAGVSGAGQPALRAARQTARRPARTVPLWASPKNASSDSTWSPSAGTGMKAGFALCDVRGVEEWKGQPDMGKANRIWKAARRNPGGRAFITAARTEAQNQAVH